MTELIFTPVEPISWSCMYCGTDLPEGVTRSEFHGWTCPDCKHMICSKCLEDLRAVNKLPECNWWACNTTKVAKVTKLQKAIIEPVYRSIATTELDYVDAPIITGNKAHVHWLGTDGQWQELMGVLATDVRYDYEDTMIIPSLGDRELHHLPGRRQGRAEIQLVMDEENMNILSEGGIYTISVETDDGMQTRFKGMITGRSELIEGPGPATITLDLIEVEVTSPLTETDIKLPEGYIELDKYYEGNDT